MTAEVAWGFVVVQVIFTEQLLLPAGMVQEEGSKESEPDMGGGVVIVTPTLVEAVIEPPPVLVPVAITVMVPVPGLAVEFAETVRVPEVTDQLTPLSVDDSAK